MRQKIFTKYGMHLKRVHQERKLFRFIDYGALASLDSLNSIVSAIFSTRSKEADV